MLLLKESVDPALGLGGQGFLVSGEHYNFCFTKSLGWYELEFWTERGKDPKEKGECMKLTWVGNEETQICSRFCKSWALIVLLHSSPKRMRALTEEAWIDACGGLA